MAGGKQNGYKYQVLDQKNENGVISLRLIKTGDDDYVDHDVDGDALCCCCYVANEVTSWFGYLCDCIDWTCTCTQNAMRTVFYMACFLMIAAVAIAFHSLYVHGV